MLKDDSLRAHPKQEPRKRQDLHMPGLGQVNKLNKWGLNFSLRLRDFAGALFGLILLTPFFALVALLIKRDSEGPIFYRGRRSGMGGKEFGILKFRTMYETRASYAGPKITAQGDDRVTPIGRWLRYTKLNELPQLWNVLIGEMSLVGPRPEDPDIVAGWTEAEQSEVLSVRPGITSPASVLFNDEETQLAQGKLMETYLKSIQPSKLRLDELYVRHRSFWLDLDVLFWTFMILLLRLEGFKPPERFLFYGPLAKFRHQLVNWFTIDLILVFLSFGMAGIFWRYFGPIHIGLEIGVLVSLGYSYLFSVVGWLMGIHKIYWRKAAITDAIYLVVSVIVSYTIGFVINSYLEILPSQIIVIASVLSLGSFVIVRYRTRLFSSLLNIFVSMNSAAKQMRERVLIVGSGDAGHFAAWMLENSRDAQRYYAVGYIDDDMFKIGTRIRGLNVLGGRDDIQSVVAEHDVGIIMFAIHNIDEAERKKIYGLCQKTAAQIVEVPNMMAEIAQAAKRSGVQMNGHNGRKELVADIKCWLGEFGETVERGAVEDRRVALDELKKLLEQKV